MMNRMKCVGEYSNILYIYVYIYTVYYCILLPTQLIQLFNNFHIYTYICIVYIIHTRVRGEGRGERGGERGEGCGEISRESEREGKRLNIYTVYIYMYIYI